jgi:hypothetical protein
MTNSSSGGAGFDPRFNPAFQPGYKPEVHGQPSVPAPGLDLPPAAGGPGRGEGHGERWQGDPRLADRRGDGATDADQRWDEDGPRRHKDADHGAEEPPAHRFDVYLVSLWVVSAAFIAGGLAVVGYISERLDKLSLTDGGNGFDYYLLQVYTIAAPLLVLFGLATAVGTLFLLAGRRGRRSTE